MLALVFTQALEALLPPRERVEIPTGENVEEVTLSEYDRSRDGPGRGRSDEESEHVQCSHQ